MPARQARAGRAAQPAPAAAAEAPAEMSSSLAGAAR